MGRRAMNEQHDPRRQPDQLEETLQDFYQAPAPPAEFVERLEQQLRARHSVLTQQHPAASAWSRLNPFRRLPMLKQHTRAFVSGVVGLVLLFVLIAGVLALFRGISQTTAINGTPTPGGLHLKLSAT